VRLIIAEVLLENVKIYEEHYGEIVVADESGKKGKKVN
jgi:hypothetical protein